MTALVGHAGNGCGAPSRCQLAEGSGGSRQPLCEQAHICEKCRSPGVVSTVPVDCHLGIITTLPTQPLPLLT